MNSSALEYNKKTIEQRVSDALGRIRPFLEADGGDVKLVKVEDDVVVVEFMGACKSCDINTMTLRAGIEDTIKREVPEIREVRLMQE